jgi:hypothetical protein
MAVPAAGAGRLPGEATPSRPAYQGEDAMALAISARIAAGVTSGRRAYEP